MALERERAYTSLTAYRALPEGCYDLIEGELLAAPSPTRRHQAITRKLAFALVAHVEAHQAGWIYFAPLDVTLMDAEPPIVVQPDILFVARGHESRLVEGGVAGPPDLVVEIASPGSMRLDAVRKRALYDRHGVLEFWLVLPEQDQLEVLRRDGDRFGRPQLVERGDQLTTPLLPGFAFDVATLFEITDP